MFIFYIGFNLQADSVFSLRVKILTQPSWLGNHSTKWKTRAVKYLKRGVHLKTEAVAVLAVTPNWSPPTQWATPKLWEPNMSPEEHHLVCGEQRISGCFKELLLTGRMHFNINRATQSDYNKWPQEKRNTLDRQWRHILQPRSPLTPDFTHTC